MLTGKAFEDHLTGHAKCRASQRNLSVAEIEFVIRYGERLHNAGAVFYQMRHKDMPGHIPANDPRHKLIGTTVVRCSVCGSIMTVYRDPRAFKKDRKKQKYRQGETYICDCQRRLH